MNRRNIKMEILWEFSKKIGIFWHICGKNIEKIGLGKLKINRKSFVLISNYKSCTPSAHHTNKLQWQSKSLSTNFDPKVPN